MFYIFIILFLDFNMFYFYSISYFGLVRFYIFNNYILLVDKFIREYI